MGPEVMGLEVGDEGEDEPIGGGYQLGVGGEFGVSTPGYEGASRERTEWSGVQ